MTHWRLITDCPANKSFFFKTGSYTKMGQFCLFVCLFHSMLHCYFNNFGFSRKLQSDRMIPFPPLVFATFLCNWFPRVNTTRDQSLRPVPSCKLFRGLVAGTSCKHYYPRMCRRLDISETPHPDINYVLLFMNKCNPYPIFEGLYFISFLHSTIPFYLSLT